MARRSTPDRFDEIPADTSRRGVHRAPRTPRDRWITFAWSALATFILVVLGVVGLIATSNTLSVKDFEQIVAIPTASPTTTSATPTPTPTATATIDPSVKVDVLNATTTAGLATTQAAKLTKAGWTIGTKDNATTTATATKVYYSNPQLKGAALGVVQSLGFGTAVQSDDYKNSSAPITVVLGSDAK